MERPNHTRKGSSDAPATRGGSSRQRYRMCVASHWFFFSLSLTTLSEQVLVNPVVGTTHKQEQRILIDSGSWSRRGQATTSYLAPAAPAVAIAQVLVNPVVGAAHKQVQLILIDGGSWIRQGQAATSYLNPAIPAAVVVEPILVNSVVGTTHKQPYQSAIDGDSWFRCGQAVTWDLAPAAPTAVREQVLVNPVVGATHKQEHLTLVDGGCGPDGVKPLPATWLQPLQLLFVSKFW